MRTPLRMEQYCMDLDIVPVHLSNRPTKEPTRLLNRNGSAVFQRHGRRVVQLDDAFMAGTY